MPASGWPGGRLAAWWENTRPRADWLAEDTSEGSMKWPSLAVSTGYRHDDVVFSWSVLACMRSLGKLSAVRGPLQADVKPRASIRRAMQLGRLSHRV